MSWQQNRIAYYCIEDEQPSAKRTVIHASRVEAAVQENQQDDINNINNKKERSSTHSNGRATVDR